MRLFVKRHLDWGGVWLLGDATKFALAYLASDELVLPPAFTGTALAPNATLHLLGGSYLGVFYGRNLQVDAGARIRALASPLLVGGIAVSTTTPCAGDEVEVTLSVPGDPTATPWIQDLVGSHQFVQFGAYGTRQIVGSVLTTDGRADWVTVPIDVQQCAAAPGAPPPLALHFHAAYGQQNTVEFVVNAFNASGAEITMTTPATYAWSFGDGQTLADVPPRLARLQPRWRPSPNSASSMPRCRSRHRRERCWNRRSSRSSASTRTTARRGSSSRRPRLPRCLQPALASR